MSADGAAEAVHSFAPIGDAHSRLLILGTMASPASLRSGMYYGHPQNAFWRLLAELTGEPLPTDHAQKRTLLLRHGIALWDTLESCERPGAADSDIRHERPSDIPALLRRCPHVQAVFLNGAAAYGFYEKYQARQIRLPYYRLPSTSPANARRGYAAKLAAWRAVAPFLT